MCSQIEPLSTQIDPSGSFFPAVSIPPAALYPKNGNFPRFCVFH
uniref:Uncharacterized protein n=1 Tax=Arundo donax TaxID=35708 RepID=A0A0A9FA21_ARUDO